MVHRIGRVIFNVPSPGALVKSVLATATVIVVALLLTYTTVVVWGVIRKEIIQQNIDILEMIEDKKEGDDLNE